MISILTALCVSGPVFAADKSGIVFNCELRSIAKVTAGGKDDGTLLTILGQNVSDSTKLPTAFRVFDPGNRLQGAVIARLEKEPDISEGPVYKFKTKLGDPIPLLLIVRGSVPAKVARNGTLEMTATVGFVDARGPQSFGICNVFKDSEAADWFDRQTKLIETPK